MIRYQIDIFGGLTQCCTQFKSPGLKILYVFHCIIMWHSHLNDMEIPETKGFIPKGVNWVQHYVSRIGLFVIFFLKAA